MARKILLADDSVTAQNMGRKILTDAGYDVVTVNNGSAALKRVAEIKPDLIVLDVYMPGYSGLEVCQRLKDSGDTSHIPVLLTVGKLEPFKADEGRRVRADSHIIKPFEASELLSAITRLEDRMLSQSATPRPGGRANGRSAETNTDADTGWRSRLSFSSKKKKEETEPISEDGSATFRDFRKGKSKVAATSSPAKAKTSTRPAPEPETVQAVPSNIPRDITPEEMDALNAVALKLNSENRSAEPLEETRVAAGVPNPEAERIAAESGEVAHPDHENQAAELPGASLEAKAEVEIPVECVEPAADHPSALEAHSAEMPSPVSEASEPAQVEAQAARVESIQEINVASLAEAPAPIDQDEEPGFATTAQAETLEEQSRPQEYSVAATDATTEQGSNAAVERASEESQVEAVKPSNPDAAILREVAEAVPSDEELVEALRLLTPATGYVESTSVPAPENMAAAGQLLAEETARNAAAGPRWVAEPAVLSSEEAALSLEAEMARTFAAAPIYDSSHADGARESSEVVGTTENGSVSAETVFAAAPQLEGNEHHATATIAVSDVTPAAVQVEAASAVAEFSEGRTITDAPHSSESVQAERPAVEETIKAMAAAAAAESSASGSVHDARTIASIVESVMADLRPKIVEEITRKLAGK